MNKSIPKNNGLGTLSTLSIGIGGMVGGGIFAVTGLAIQVTKGSAPIAFVIAGIVALLTSYSYLKLTLRYPGEGGTVQFLNNGFGNNIATGTINILLLFSYVVLISIYAYAFGSYGASFFPDAERDFWQYLLTSGIVVSLLLINIFGKSLIIKSENLFNILKLVLLIGFVVLGLTMPMDWSRMEPDNFVSPMGMIAGAMLIFLNYEGFELIANASGEVDNPKKSLPVAYVGGVLFVMLLYFLIVAVVIGHLSFAEVGADSDRSLSIAANEIMGRSGFLAIAVAALLATTSAINASFFSVGRLTYIIANDGQLPERLKKTFHKEHIVGTVLTSVLVLFIANFVPLEAIAAMGSAGFLIIFMMVNLANVRLAKQTKSMVWLSGIAALSTGFALVMLVIKVEENPATRNHIWILIGMIMLSFLIEFLYRKFGKKT
jgi:hypothetical protein